MAILKRYLILFFKGCRPKTWSASLLPFSMASVFAYKQTQMFEWDTFFLTGLSILMIQITVDFFNDAIDGQQGLDNSKTRLGSARLTGSGQASFSEVQNMAFSSAFLAVLFALPLIWKGGPLIALAGILSLLAAYFYTGSSYSLLKLGLSELSALIFFGFFNVFGTYYLQTLSLSGELIYLSLQCGFWTVFILLINHLRDEKEDIKSGRKHLVTLYGRENSLFFIVILQGFTYLLCFYWINSFPLAGIFCFLSFPFSCFLFYQLCCRPVEKYTPLLALCSFCYLLFGGAWMIGVLFNE